MTIPRFTNRELTAFLRVGLGSYVATSFALTCFDVVTVAFIAATVVLFDLFFIAQK